MAAAAGGAESAVAGVSGAVLPNGVKLVRIFRKKKLGFFFLGRRNLWVLNLNYLAGIF